jgi:hypothetical protein
MSLHQRTHPKYVDGCFGCKVGTLVVGYCGKGNQDASAQKAWDSELDLYTSAVASGIQPESTKRGAIQAAIDWSEQTGTPYSEEAKQKHDENYVLERYAI